MRRRDRLGRLQCEAAEVAVSSKNLGAHTRQFFDADLEAAVWETPESEIGNAD